MANIAQKLTDLVGNTPLVQLNSYSEKEQLQTNIIAKLEYFNPAGSVKDPTAIHMHHTQPLQGHEKCAK